MAGTATVGLKEQISVCKLKPTDILLIHTKRSLWGWLIRFATRCYWNHALMVCTVEETKQDYGAVMVIDPKTSGSIEWDCATHYLDRLKKYDVAVKRLEADWFQGVYPVDRPSFRSRICNIALNEVDIKLGSQLGELVDKITRQTTLVFRFVRRMVRGAKPPLNIPRIIRPIQFKAFTCGGFVQWCYYQGISRTLAESGTNMAKLKEVIFNPRIFLWMNSNVGARKYPPNNPPISAEMGVNTRKININWTHRLWIGISGVK